MMPEPPKDDYLWLVILGLPMIMVLLVVVALFYMSAINLPGIR